MQTSDLTPSPNATAPTPAAARSSSTVTSPQREPPVFAGLRGDDVEEWLDLYNRVGSANRWTEAEKLSYLPFYLTSVAKTWYFNHETDFVDWSTFANKLRQIFGCSSGRSEAAKQKLAVRLQLAHESYTSYIEDVLALCRRANKDMTEDERVRHILKGIGPIAFNALAVGNPATVNDVISTCQRLDQLQSLRLQQDSDPRLMPPSELKTLIRTIIREELRDLEQQRSTVASAPSPPFDLRNLVKQELAAMATPTSPVAPPARPMPTYADVTPRSTPAAPVVQTVMPTYAEIAAIPPAPGASSSTDTASSHLAAMRGGMTAAPLYPQWRQARPVCFYCGIRGHISRYCRRRQQEERRGYAEFERDRFRRPDLYAPDTYPSAQYRSPSPPMSPRQHQEYRSSRRRSPSPYRRSASPLRPIISRPVDQSSEN